MAGKQRPHHILRGAEAVVHPAACAWRCFAGEPERASDVEILKPDHKRGYGAFRLLGAGPNGMNICAKRGSRDTLELEHLVYCEVLPSISMPALHCYGLLDDEEPNRAWLFLEDAGELCFDGSNRGHVAALSEWLGRLHGAGERWQGERLPSRSAGHYLDVLSEGRAVITANLGNESIPAGSAVMLRELIGLLDEVQERWDEIGYICESFPETLIHDDIKPKNVRIRSSLGVCPSVHVFDWEMVGFGIPASDLTRGLDLMRYHYGRCLAGGASIDQARLQQMVHIGRLFGTLNAISWTSRWLRHRWLDRPLRALSSYRAILLDWSDRGLSLVTAT